MESFNIDQSKLEEYAENFSKKACDSFFSMFKSTVVGSEIMKITPIEQINYFVLFNLFENWKQEVAKLESPYFDYSKAEVKEALRNFMNTVSMHINISREHLEPLIRRSVIYTINLVSIPKIFFANFFNNLPDKISIEQLSSYEKYFRIYKALYSSTLERVKSLGNEEITKTYLLNTFAEVCENFEEEKKQREHIMLNFNTVLQVNFEDFYAPIIHHVKITDPIAEKEEIETSIEAEIDEKKTPPVANEISETSISDLKKENFKPSSNNQIHNRIVDVKAAMTINQRFMFVEQLFKGEKWEFDNALSKLENCADYDAAIKMLLTEYAMKYEWDTENEQVSELFDFIGKKYSH